MGYVKVYKYKKQYSLDGGVTWQDVTPAEYAPSGEPIGYYDTYEECIAQYRTIQSGYTCVGVDKHNQDVYEVSYDEGATWSVVSTSAGTLIEANSPDCGYIPPTPCECSAFTFDTTSHTITDTAQSVTFNYSGCTKPDLSSASTYGWMLIANHEYNAETTVGYITANVSANTSSARTGILYTSLSGSTCQNLVISQQAPIQYRWTQSGTTCIGYDKYQNNIKEQSTDGGVTWTVVTPPEYSASTLIEADSPDCGYVPPQTKYKLTLNDSSTVSAECDSTSSITQAEISAYTSTTVSAEIGNCVTSIGHNAFANCSGLTSIDIPNSVTSIGSWAFYNCSGLTSIGIPSGVTSIYGGTFWGCTSLTSIDIPSGVTSIGVDAFYYCTSLTSITVNATTPPTLVGGALDDTNNCPIYVPCASVDAYKSATNWSTYADRIQGIPPCEQPTFNGKYQLTLNDSSTVSAECDSSSAITQAEISAYTSTIVLAEIGDCVISIDEQAFSGCTGLTSIDIPNRVTSIDRYAFFGCIGLTSCTIGTSVTSIGTNAFMGCSGLTNITIPNSVTTIGSGAFYNCSGLTSCTIGTSVTSISSSAFYGCSGLTSIDIPSGVTSIGSYAFAWCSSLTSIDIPSGVTYLDSYAFKKCSGLTGITINATTPPRLRSSVFVDTNNCPIYVPSGSVSAYQSSWSDYASRIQAIP